MKMQRAKDLVTGAIISALVVGVTPVALAKTGATNILVQYSNIKVVVDGKELSTSKEPFIYDGTTYLPLRAVAEAVGKEVSWDNAAKVAYLGGKTAENPEPDVKPVGYSRTNPAPVNTEQAYLNDSKYSTKYRATLEVKEVIRGSSAWSKIKAENMYNDEAPAGKEYVLAKIKATVNSVDDEKSINFSSYDFKAFSGTNSEYSRASVVCPKPDFGGSVYAGGSTEGYVVFLVDKSDTNPKFVYGEDYEGKGGVWFSLNP